MFREDKLITFTSDFGDQLAPSQVKGVAYSARFRGILIENNDTPQFSVLEGAFALAILARFCPPGSVHVGVVDPGVGSIRRGIVVKTKNSWGVGPDNGLLIPKTREDGGIEKAWGIDREEIQKRIKITAVHNEGLSETFDGRDVFIKAAVALAKGRSPESFGCKRIDPSTLVNLAFQDGQVLRVDPTYGNTKFFLGEIPEIGTQIEVRHNGRHVIVPVVRTFSDVGPGQPLVLRKGSSGIPEFAVNYGHGAKFLQNGSYKVVCPGDILDIREYKHLLYE